MLISIKIINTEKINKRRNKYQSIFNLIIENQERIIKIYQKSSTKNELILMTTNTSKGALQNVKKIYPKEFKSDLENAELHLTIKSAELITIKAFEKAFPGVYYYEEVQSKDKNPKLIKFLENNEGSLSSKFSIVFQEKQAFLNIKYSDQFNLKQTLPLKNKELKSLLMQQNELDDDIKELYIQIDELKQIGKDKDQQMKNSQNQKTQIQKRLDQINVIYKQKKQKFVGNDLQLDPNYSKYIKKDGNKHRLFMKEMNVTDGLIKEIVQFDLKKVQVLSLGDNQITDYGFNLLFKDKGKKYWPVLFEIFLQNNKITKIHSLEEIQTLEKLALYQNELEEQTADYFCKYQWMEIVEFRVSFKKGENEKSWKKLIPKLSTIFPKLKELWYTNEDDIGAITKKKILDLCNSNHWALNHSMAGIQGLGALGALGGLGGLGGIVGGEGGNGLQTLIKLQLVSQLLKGAGQKQ